MVRADAARNRDLLLAAARDVFARRGLNATLDEIAAAAGVGTGTAYRHFPNKHALAAELLADATAQIARDALAALVIADPWAALVSFFETTGARLVAEQGLYEALAGQGRVADKVTLWPQIVDAVTRLFDRAHAAGALRVDAKPEDAAVMLSMLGVAGAAWPRYLTLLLDGLRATDRGQLPCPAPAFAALDDVIAASKRR